MLLARISDDNSREHEWYLCLERLIVMFCPKCGKPSVAGAAFCMHCGQRYAPTAPAPAPAQAPMMQGAAPAFPNPAVNSKKTTWIAIGTALAMILAIFFGLRATGILQFGAKNPQIEALRAEGNLTEQELLKAEGNLSGQELLRAEGEDPKIPLLRAEGSPPPPTLNQGAQRIEMPADIRRWLEHLEAIEKRKNDLSMKQLSQMAVLMQQMKVLGGGMGMLNEEEGGYGGDLGPSETAKGSFDAMRPEWNQLITDFRSFPPPAECKPIADDYNRAINEIPGMNSDLAEILAGVASDPAAALEKVMKIQNTSSNVIDRYLGASDSKVGDICRKYETRKWFDIKTDVGGGLMGKFGL